LHCSFRSVVQLRRLPPQLRLRVRQKVKFTFDIVGHQLLARPCLEAPAGSFTKEGVNHGQDGSRHARRTVATLVKYKLPVKVIVIKNNVLGMIKWEQMAFEGNPQFGVELQPIDFAGFAEACGARGFTIERPEEAESVLAEALAYNGPAIVQAVVDPNEPPLPGNITMKQALKFAEALLRGEKDRWKIIKTVIADKIREVI
jgi:pyruvate dehydrogenase (quinone)